MKYLIILLLSISLSCFASYQEADQVFSLIEDDKILHIGWYIPKNCYIITITEGPDKGLQQIFYGSYPVLFSIDIELHDKYFIHYYRNFKVYSNDDTQRIVFTRGMKCSE